MAEGLSGSVTEFGASSAGGRAGCPACSSDSRGLVGNHSSDLVGNLFWSENRHHDPLPAAPFRLEVRVDAREAAHREAEPHERVTRAG